MLQQGAFKFVIKQINSTALSSTWLTREKIEAIENKEDVHKFCITIAIGKKAGDKNYAPKFGKKGKQKSRHWQLKLQPIIIKNPCKRSI